MAREAYRSTPHPIWLTGGHAQIALIDFACGEGEAERSMRLIGACDDHHARGVFVQAMDNPGTLDPADTRQPHAS